MQNRFVEYPLIHHVCYHRLSLEYYLRINLSLTFFLIFSSCLYAYLNARMSVAERVWTANFWPLVVPSSQAIYSSLWKNALK